VTPTSLKFSNISSELIIKASLDNLPEVDKFSLLLWAVAYWSKDLTPSQIAQVHQMLDQIERQAFK